MKFSIAFLLSILSIFSLNAADTLVVKTIIDQVNIYFVGAEIARTGNIQLKAGKNLVKIIDLPYHLEEKTVQLKTDPKVKLLTIKTLKHEPSFAKSEAQKKIEQKIEQWQDSIRVLQNQMAVQIELERILNENRRFSNKEGVAQLTEVKQAVIFYEEKLSSIKSSIFHLQQQTSNYQSKIEELAKTIAALQEESGKYSSSVVVELEANQTGKYPINLKYFSDLAGWKPQYDLRVDNIDEAVRITFRAKVYQTTGEDWSEIPLNLLSGIPRESNEKPQLQIWNVQFPQPVPIRQDLSTPGKIHGKVTDSQTNEALAFANISLFQNNERKYSTTSDFDGKFNFFPIQAGYYLMEVNYVGYQTQSGINLYVAKNQTLQQLVRLEPQQYNLAEVVVTSDNMPILYKDQNIRASRTGALKVSPDHVQSFQTINFIENSAGQSMTQMNYAIQEKVSIPSDGQENTISIKEIIVPAYYQHQAVPQYDPDVFLTAGLVNFNEMMLLPGDALVFFEDNYVGETFLDFQSSSDTLNISLGRDKHILIERKAKKQMGGKRLIGNTVRDLLAYELIITNKRASSIDLIIEEQIPISTQKEIEITLTQTQEGKYDNKTGFVSWVQKLGANQKQSIEYEYQIKYPDHIQFNFRR